MSDESLEKPSKSQRKREMIQLQQLGEKLVKLPQSQLELIPLDTDLKKAITDARLITAHGAKRRQLQYIGKLMRSADTKIIEDSLNKILSKNVFNNLQFHQAERWRNLFLSDDITNIDNFIEKFPNTDRDKLIKLIKATKTDKKFNTELFRFIRQIIEKSC